MPPSRRKRAPLCGQGMGFIVSLTFYRLLFASECLEAGVHFVQVANFTACKGAVTGEKQKRRSNS